MRAHAPSTYILALRPETPPSGTPPLLPIPLPTPSPPLLLPSTVCRECVSKVTLPPRKRLCIVLGLRYEVDESSSAPTARPTGGFKADYGFVATLDDDIRQDPKRFVGLSQRMTDFVTTVRQDTDEIYVRLDDAQDDRSLMSGQLNMLFRDRRAHARTALIMEREARLSHEAWGQSMDASNTACSEVRALRTIVLAHQTEIAALRAADRARQAQLVETLRLMSTLQTQVTALQGQQGPARGPTQPKVLYFLMIEENGTKKNHQSQPRDTTALFLNIKMAMTVLHSGITSVRRTERVARECTYPDFMKCQPLNFKGMEGVVKLIQWFEKMETVFSISNYSMENQIKFFHCIFEQVATWWNSHVRTVGDAVAYAITWTDLKKKMTDKCCLRGEIKKLEAEL
ncbi:hypothetical protein Tco_0860616 [Tanacetum coccineum]|uniref:Reverse transcriptase domain-containing protein n=1 Tax=Tanacetum coccineum TaxID=301880 RepID=A0ABQ5BJH2_9ASTR